MVGEGLEGGAHAFVVGGDDGDEVEFGEHQDELPAGTAAGDAVKFAPADLHVGPPPEEAVGRALWVGVEQFIQPF